MSDATAPRRALHLLAGNLRFALRALGAHRLRAVLTMLGIVIGVVTVIAMVGIVDGYRRAIVADMTSFGATLVQFQKYEPSLGPDQRDREKERRDLTLEDALAIQRLAPSIAAVSPERYKFPFPDPFSVTAAGREAYGTIVGGVYPDYMVANNHFVDEGRFISAGDVARATPVAVIGRDVAKALFPRQDPLDRTINVAERRYRVIGIFEHKGSTLGGSSDNFVMIPFSSFDRQFPEVSRGGDTIHIATIPKRPEWVSRAIDEGTAILRARRKLRPADPNDFAIFTPDKLLEQMASVVNGISVVMVFLASVSLLVGGVGVTNIMLVAVSERTREVGLRMALGARRRDIVLQFLSEAATLTGLGGMAGVGLGVGLVLGVRAAGLLPATAPAWAIGLGLLVSVSLGLFFGLYPALRASRLDPIEALRYE